MTSAALRERRVEAAARSIGLDVATLNEYVRFAYRLFCVRWRRLPRSVRWYAFRLFGRGFAERVVAGFLAEAEAQNGA